jgi:hypothetical protein
MWYGNNADIADLPLITAGFRKRHSISISGEDDGSIRYAIQETEVDELSDSFKISGTGTEGMGKQAFIGSNVDPATLDSIIGGLSPSEILDYDISASGNDDGTVDYVIRETTKISKEETFSVGSKGKSVEVTVATNMNAMPNVSTPSSEGVTLELIATINDAGGIDYRKTESTVSAQDATVQGGQHFKTISRKHVVGDVNKTDLDASSTVQEGVSVKWQLVLSQDGSVNWVKDTETVEGDSTGALDMRNLVAYKQRFGYSDTVDIFTHIKLSELSGKCNYTGDKHGFVDSIQVFDDGTVSGRAVTRKYKVDTGDYPFNMDMPITWSAPMHHDGTEQIRKFYTPPGGETVMKVLDIEWNYSYYAHPDFEAVDDHLEGSYGSPSISKISLYGAEMWMGVKKSNPTYGTWVTVGGNLSGAA